MSGDTSNEQAISPTEAKLQLGRNLARRPQKHHQGERSDPTAFDALKLAAAGGGQKPPTKLEMDILFGDNPSQVRTFRSAGWTDDKIYEILNR